MKEVTIEASKMLDNCWNSWDKSWNLLLQWLDLRVSKTKSTNLMKLLTKREYLFFAENYSTVFLLSPRKTISKGP